MSEVEKLVEDIAKEGVALYAFPNLWERLHKSEKDSWREWAKNKILPLVKEAGYLPVETSRTPATDLENDLADKEFAKQYRDARIKSSWEIKMVEELGYIPPESYIPVQLEVPGDEEIKEVRFQAYLSEGYLPITTEIGIKDLIKKTIRTTIAHNEAKGKLYRVKE